MLEEIERLTSEIVSDDDLADNQSYFTGTHALAPGKQRRHRIATSMAWRASDSAWIIWPNIRQDTVYRIETKTDLLAAAQRYLGAGDMVIAVAGPDQTARQFAQMTSANA